MRSWLRRPEVVEPKYPPRKSAIKLDGWTEVLRTWLRSDSHRAKRERRTASEVLTRPLGISNHEINQETCNPKLMIDFVPSRANCFSNRDFEVAVRIPTT